MPVLLFGFLLMLVSGSLAGLLVTGNLYGGQSYTVKLLGRPLEAAMPVEIFAAGAAVAVVFCLGMQLCVAATRRRLRLQAQFQDMEDQASALSAERDRLAAELRNERTARLNAEVFAPPPNGATGDEGRYSEGRAV